MNDMKRIQPSRILNDNRGVFGLWLSDFAAAVAVFMGGSWILEGTGIELSALFLALGALAVLGPIRLATRRGIIRDFIRWCFTSKVVYDPKT